LLIGNGTLGRQLDADSSIGADLCFHCYSKEYLLTNNA